MLLRDLGERSAIESVWRAIGSDMEEEDAYYWRAGNGYALLTTDMIYARTHIPPGVDFGTVGRFFAAINLSDIAAMGGVPRVFLTAVGAPPDMPEEDLVEFEVELAKELKRYGAEFGGGDLKEGCDFIAAGTLYGEVEAERIMLRRGAAPGDHVYVTGRIGKAAASYHFWRAGSGSGREMLEVVPRLKEGRTASLHASAGMDLSDGIAEAVFSLSRLNGVGFEIWLEEIPLHPLAEEAIEEGADPMSIALGFGGDYELFLTVPPGRAEEFERAMGGNVKRIGTVVRGENVVVAGGERVALTGRGYQHFT